MRDEAEVYRERASYCRKLAETARDKAGMRRLIDLAEDFEQEARRLDEEAAHLSDEPDGRI